MDRVAATPAPSLRPVPAAVPGRASAALVWGVWLASLAGALLYVAWFGHAFPCLDDFAIVPYVTGEADVTASWFWEQHNEHRIPLPKLLLLALLRSGGGDFRAGMYASVLCLGAAAGLLVWAARRLRGRASPADAFFPLVFLHLGNGENFLWGWQITTVLPTAFAGAYVALLASGGARLNAVALPAAGFGLLLLTLSGPPGLAYVPLLTLWLGYCGARCWRRGPGRRAAVLLSWALAAGACLLLAVYFVGYQPVAHRVEDGAPVPRDARAVVRTTLQYLSLGLGCLARPAWPFSGLAVLGLGVVSTVILMAAWVRRPRERVRVAGLLSFVGGAAALALTIGWGRTELGHNSGFARRYVTFLAPALGCSFFAWELYGPAALRRWARAGLLLFAGVVFALDLPDGLDFGAHYGGRMAALEQDLSAGAPFYEIASRHYSALSPDSQVTFVNELRALARAGVEPFRRLREGPLLEVPLAMTPCKENHVTAASGKDAYLEYSLPEPVFLAGIRITYSHDRGDGGWPSFRMSWKRDEHDAFPAEPPYREWYVPTGEDQTLTVWIADTVSAIRLYPNQAPGDFRVAEVVLLKPLPD